MAILSVGRSSTSRQRQIQHTGNSMIRIYLQRWRARNNHSERLLALSDDLKVNTVPEGIFRVSELVQKDQSDNRGDDDPARLLGTLLIRVISL